MREIKFRAWDKSENQMARSVSELLFNNKGLYGVKLNHMGFEFMRRIKDIELMQYTGLKDKNSKEIYEGDIVKAQRYDGCDFKGEVKFRDCSFFIDTGCISIFNWPDFEFEIIGNIHQNPELLEVQDVGE